MIRRLGLFGTGTVVIIASLLLIAPRPSSARHPVAQELDRDALRGLKGVFVGIASLPEPIQAAGLRETDLQTAVELRLRKAGVPVLTFNEWPRTPGMPGLQIKMWAIRGMEGETMPCFGYVECFQTVLLERDTKISTAATTWNDTFVGGTHRIKDLEEAVLRCVDRFANDYLAANTKGTNHE